MKNGQNANTLTLEEKINLCSGKDFWCTQEIPRLHIQETRFSDGPHGLRKQTGQADHLGTNPSLTAICFPSGAALAASFDRELLVEIGQTLGRECQAEGIDVLLGPSMNIKRSPLCGRNFEYFSEDPCVTGELAAAYIQGLQSKNIGASPKHFAVNNQENQRMYSSSDVDERTLREIYLHAFETVVDKAQPWTIMCSYNRLNGVYTSENKWLLQDILRKEWGFAGCVISDWGAVSNRPLGISAGMDLEMPGNGGKNKEAIQTALHKGVLLETELDTCAGRVAALAQRCHENRVTEKQEACSLAQDHERAIRAAERCIVLLKNSQVLPLQAKEKILFVGEFVEHPRYQGGGSSHIAAFQVETVLERIMTHETSYYVKGFRAADDHREERLLKEAETAAMMADKIVVFAGLPESYESEGYDRSHMRLPAVQNELIFRLTALHKPVIVVLQNGSPVEMPWESAVQGILELYLGGEGVGAAIWNILFGKANPSGRLAETFPHRLEDIPSYPGYSGNSYSIPYSEGIFVGYRYYEKKKLSVLYPFGYGLSYTQFAYGKLVVRQKKQAVSAANSKDVVLTAEITVKNIGDRAGREVVQLYMADQTEVVPHPEKELRDFACIYLEPGESKSVCFTLTVRDFCWYDSFQHTWWFDSGKYMLAVGKSSQNLLCKALISLINEQADHRPPCFPINPDMMLGDLLQHSWTKQYTEKEVLPYVERLLGRDINAKTEKVFTQMVRYLPIRALRNFGVMTDAEVMRIVDEIQEICRQKNIV